MLFAIPFPDIDPVLFSVTVFDTELALRWYALAYIAGLLIGWRYVVLMMRRDRLWAKGQAPLTPQQPEDLLTWMVIGVVVGGRLGFVAFYQAEYYFDHWPEILQVWRGGMSFHGGFIGVMLGILLYSWRNKVNPISVGDAVAAAAPIGIIFGRIANFINAELWGRPTNLSWGVVFPSAAAQDCGPEFGEICARHPSQLYQAGLEGLFLFLVLAWMIWRRGWLTRPGRVTGLFFLGYGLARVLVEGFRQGDPQFVSEGNPFGFVIRFGADFGLTMGQCLSLPMVLIGAAILWATRVRR